MSKALGLKLARKREMSTHPLLMLAGGHRQEK